MKKVKVLFLCGGKDFHAMDKYKLIVDAMSTSEVVLVTDTIEGEGQFSLIKDSYKVERLFILDKFTPNYQSKLTHRWRNFLKILLLPIQVLKLRKIYKRYQPHRVHSVPIYYMFLCYLAKIPFIGTPQAAEILVRPLKSKLYNYFARKTLKKASIVIVDSLEMKDSIKENMDVKAKLIKNGFDTQAATLNNQKNKKRIKVVSIRGIQKNYQTFKIIKARNKSKNKLGIDFIFPFYNSNYLSKLKNKIDPLDNIIGRVSRNEMYDILSETLLAISIPDNDSSPRSVYEAIFCGAIIAITAEKFYDELPSCMKKRIYIVNLTRENWFDEAIKFAKINSKKLYVPSKEALEMCNQKIITNYIIKNIYQL